MLDQGYWSDGMLMAPSGQAMVHDIDTMKRLGFTMLRKHVTVEPLRWYSHCDRLGMLVWQDIVNGGGPYHPAVTAVPAVVAGVRLPDRWHAAFARSDTRARGAWLAEMGDTVEHLRNVVSLAVWVPSNEGWGQCGWHDEGAGDITSLHVYVRPFRMPRSRSATAHRAVALTEYAGYSWRVDGHTTTQRAFGYRRLASQPDLEGAFTRLHERQVIPAVAAGLCATVFTQLSDVEDETNGLLTADRRVQKISDEVVANMTARLRLD